MNFEIQRIGFMSHLEKIREKKSNDGERKVTSKRVKEMDNLEKIVQWDVRQ